MPWVVTKGDPERGIKPSLRWSRSVEGHQPVITTLCMICSGSQMDPLLIDAILDDPPMCSRCTFLQQRSYVGHKGVGSADAFQLLRASAALIHLDREIARQRRGA